MKLKLLIILILSLVLFVSCTKKKIERPTTYTKEEFAALSHNAAQVNPVGENAIPFADYLVGVNKLNSKTLIFERLKFHAIEFETEDQAKSEARRLNQYYSRNILFDRVEGEPILEDYVISTFQAENPNRHVQRVPKKNATHETHGGGHGDPHAPAKH